MEIIKYNIKDFINILSTADFLEHLGLYDHENQKWEFNDVRQIAMNKRSAQTLLQFLNGNQKKHKGFIRNMNRTLYLSSVAMDWLQYSPLEVLNIPEDELWVNWEENFNVNQEILHT